MKKYLIRLSHRIGGTIILLLLRALHVIFHTLMLLYQILIAIIMIISPTVYKRVSRVFVRQMEGDFGVNRRHR